MNPEVKIMLYIIFFFVLGLIVGSFLNVCIYRLARGESIIFPSSYCPQCQHKLNISDLIPVFSYLFLAGKCRYCQAPISFRYPLVELATGVLFSSMYFLFPTFLELIFGLFFVCVLVIIFFIDLEHQVIPDSVSLSGIAGGLIYGLILTLIAFNKLGFQPALTSILGALLGYAILFSIAKLGKVVFKKEAMGEGDLFVAALLGAFLGWQGVLLALFLAYLLAGLAAVLLLVLGRVKLGESVPFGPALALGGILALFFGKQLLTWYLALFI